MNQRNIRLLRVDYIHSKLLPLHKISLQIVIPEERHLYFSIFFITLRLKEVVIV